MFDIINVWQQYSAVIWLVIGATLIAAEVFFVTGIGLLFAGVAALCTGIIVLLGWIGEENLYYQLSSFFAITTCLLGILWKPLRKLGKKKKYIASELTGSHAIIGNEPLSKGKIGLVKWSGTWMQARLAEESSLDSLPSGTEVIVKEVHGTTLIVRPIDLKPRLE